MLSASFVAEKMGLIGYDPYHVTKALHHKHEFKQLASSISMSITPYEIFPSTKLPTLGHLRFPLLIKPVDLTGGKGISRIDNISQLPGAITKAKEQSHQDLLIAEEWFDGSLHSYSTIIKDQKIIFEDFDSEFCLYHDFLVSTSISSAPTDNQVRQGLANEVSRLIKELQLADGVLHCQYLLGYSG